MGVSKQIILTSFILVNECSEGTWISKYQAESGGNKNMGQSIDYFQVINLIIFIPISCFITINILSL